jgi:formylglycine-generating enzyme required for sulfatase activity
MPTSVQDSLPPYLQSLYQNDPSAAIHSLSGWLLEKWGFGNLRDAADETDVPYDPRSNRQWFRLSLPLTDNSGRKSGNQPTDKLRLTFIVIPAGDYTIGTPPRTITVTAPFAVCDRELPQSVWVRCQKQARPEPLDKPDPSPQQTASASDPAASSLSWIDAAVICRWLTQKHRGTSESWQCFSQTITTDIRADRLGFRMPTSDEWDIVCSRKGAKAFASGSNPQLLNFYSWFTPDATAPQPPARKPPTPNGLFDCHGNVSEWTLDASQPGFRIHRGSSWDSTPLLSMLNTSYSSPENTAATNVGLRLACTLPDNNRRPNSRK